MKWLSFGSTRVLIAFCVCHHSFSVKAQTNPFYQNINNPQPNQEPRLQAPAAPAAPGIQNSHTGANPQTGTNPFYQNWNSSQHQANPNSPRLEAPGEARANPAAPKPFYTAPVATTPFQNQLQSAEKYIGEKYGARNPDGTLNKSLPAGDIKTDGRLHGEMMQIIRQGAPTDPAQRSDYNKQVNEYLKGWNNQRTKEWTADAPKRESADFKDAAKKLDAAEKAFREATDYSTIGSWSELKNASTSDLRKTVEAYAPTLSPVGYAATKAGDARAKATGDAFYKAFDNYVNIVHQKGFQPSVLNTLDRQAISRLQSTTDASHVRYEAQMTKYRAEIGAYGLGRDAATAAAGAISTAIAPHPILKGAAVGATFGAASDISHASVSGVANAKQETGLLNKFGAYLEGSGKYYEQQTVPSSVKGAGIGVLAAAVPASVAVAGGVGLTAWSAKSTVDQFHNSSTDKLKPLNEAIANVNAQQTVLESNLASSKDGIQKHELTQELGRLQEFQGTLEKQRGAYAAALNEGRVNAWVSATETAMGAFMTGAAIKQGSSAAKTPTSAEPPPLPSAEISRAPVIAEPRSNPFSSAEPSTTPRNQPHGDSSIQPVSHMDANAMLGQPDAFKMQGGSDAHAGPQSAPTAGTEAVQYYTRNSGDAGIFKVTGGVEVTARSGGTDSATGKSYDGTGSVTVSNGRGSVEKVPGYVTLPERPYDLSTQRFLDPVVRDAYAKVNDSLWNRSSFTPASESIFSPLNKAQGNPLTVVTPKGGGEPTYGYLNGIAKTANGEPLAIIRNYSKPEGGPPGPNFFTAPLDRVSAVYPKSPNAAASPTPPAQISAAPIETAAKPAGVSKASSPSPPEPFAANNVSEVAPREYSAAQARMPAQDIPVNFSVDGKSQTGTFAGVDPRNPNYGFVVAQTRPELANNAARVEGLGVKFYRVSMPTASTPNGPAPFSGVAEIAPREYSAAQTRMPAQDIPVNFSVDGQNHTGTFAGMDPKNPNYGFVVVPTRPELPNNAARVEGLGVKFYRVPMDGPPSPSGQAASVSGAVTSGSSRLPSGAPTPSASPAPSTGPAASNGIAEIAPRDYSAAQARMPAKDIPVNFSHNGQTQSGTFAGVDPKNPNFGYVVVQTRPELPNNAARTEGLGVKFYRVPISTVNGFPHR